MKKFLAALVVLFWTPFAAAAPANVDPLGLELGVATLAQVQGALKGNRLTEIGTSAIAGGRLLQANNPSVGPEGLRAALFIFDREDRLVGVQMTLPKDFGGKNLAAIANQLSRKYTQKSRNLPLVGDASARYTRGNSVVIVEAPHLSFEFTVTYMTDDFQRNMTAHQHAREQQKATRTKDAL